mmetsp:Transcript_20216/g.64944  ORF Transcript_20216/g.64944 Transcript_20216/m.64944 type:complete len:210 (+) Transcript_20216:1425-2054(+)
MFVFKKSEETRTGPGRTASSEKRSTNGTGSPLKRTSASVKSRCSHPARSRAIITCERRPPSLAKRSFGASPPALVFTHVIRMSAGGTPSPPMVGTPRRTSSARISESTANTANDRFSARTAATQLRAMWRELWSAMHAMRAPSEWRRAASQTASTEALSSPSTPSSAPALAAAGTAGPAAAAPEASAACWTVESASMNSPSSMGRSRWE